MDKRQIVAVLLAFWAMAAVAQKSQDSITVATDPDSNGRSAVLCCTPADLYSSKEQTCLHTWSHPGGGKSLNLTVKLLCDDLRSSASIVAPDGDWYVFRKAQPTQGLFLVNCNSRKAWMVEPHPAAAPSPDPDPPSSGNVQAANSSPQASGNAGTSKQANPEKLNKRLDKFEQDLKEQKTAVKSLQEDLKQRTTENQELEKKIKALREDVLKQLRTVEDAQKNSCIRSNDKYQGRDEVTIAVAGGVLRFLKVEPQDSTITIGLADARADELLAKAQARSGKPIVPHIYLAVPEAVREVKAFFLQDRLIDPQLYSRLTGGKDANRVAYQDVSRFIDELNTRCAGRATFVLPSEEQFVAAAHELYDPVESGLTSCEELRKQDRSFGITELLGHSWQLTRSLCQPLGERARFTCPDNSYVRKGGAASSTNPLECLPEYRSPAPLDVQQKETSFRLALAD